MKNPRKETLSQEKKGDSRHWEVAEPYNLGHKIRVDARYSGQFNIFDMTTHVLPFLLPTKCGLSRWKDDVVAASPRA